MPNAKAPVPSQALIQIAWFTRKNGRPTAAVFRLGLPAVAGLALLLRGTHFDLGRKIAKAIATALGVGP